MMCSIKCKAYSLAIPVFAVLFCACSSKKHEPITVQEEVTSQDVISKLQEPVVIADTLESDTLYVGNFLLDSDGSELEISLRADGKYDVRIGLVGLTSLDDGVGSLTGNGLEFTATDAAGNPIKGIVASNGDVAKVTFTNSTWEYLPDGCVYEFSRRQGAMSRVDSANE